MEFGPRDHLKNYFKYYQQPVSSKVLPHTNYKSKFSQEVIVAKMSVLFVLIIDRIGRVNGAVSVLTALGFREQEASVLELSLEADIRELEARKLEIEAGLNFIMQRFANTNSGFASPDKDSQLHEKVAVEKEKQDLKSPNSAKYVLWAMHLYF